MTPAPSRFASLVLAPLLAVLAVTALASCALASPPAQEEVEPEGEANADVVVEDLQRAPHAPPAALDLTQGRMVGTFGFFGAGFAPRARAWRLGGTEIGALEGANVPRELLAGHVRYGGVTWGSGFRPLSWLRLPEFRFSLGGGDHETRWTPLGDGGLEGAVTRSFLLRLELVAGVEVDLGQVTPFARLYGGVGAHWASLKVRDATLGALGRERLVAFAGDVGAELGFDLYFTGDADERVGLRVAYRRGFVGAEEHGVLVGLAILGKRNP